MAISFNDFLILSERDMKSCTLFEAEFPDEYAVSTAMYHMEQAIEKQLKALLLLNGEEPPCTNDIRRLMQKCAEFTVLPAELDIVADSLTLWESKTRYDPYIVFSRTQYDLAKRAYGEIKENLNEILMEYSNAEQNEEEFTDERSYPRR